LFLSLFVLWILFVIISGSSNRAAKTSAYSSQEQPLSQLPYEVKIVRSPETEDMEEIQDQAVSLLSAKHFDLLDKYARDFRSSKASYANGVWKLSLVYFGLESSYADSQKSWNDRLALLKDWAIAEPNSITAHVALAAETMFYTTKELAQTGNDNHIRQQQVKEFRHALDILDEAGSFEETCPCWWTIKLESDKVLQVERSQFEADFESATNFEPDFEQFYLIKAVYLANTWHKNDLEIMENDLEKSADRIGSENGDELYAQVVWNIYPYMGGIKHAIFQDNYFSWPRVKSGFGVIRKRFPDSLSAVSQEAYFSGLADDRDTARKCLNDIQGQVDLGVWHSKDNFTSFANWAYGIRNL